MLYSTRDGAAGQVLVFCGQGANRSAIVVTGIIMLATGLSVQRVVEYLQSIRCIVCISSTQRDHTVHHDRTAMSVLSQHLPEFHLPNSVTDGNDWAAGIAEFASDSQLRLPDKPCLLIQCCSWGGTEARRYRARQC